MSYFKCTRGQYVDFKDPRPTHRAGTVQALLALEPYARAGVVEISRTDQGQAYCILAVHRAARNIRAKSKVA